MKLFNWFWKKRELSDRRLAVPAAASMLFIACVCLFVAAVVTWSMRTWLIEDFVLTMEVAVFDLFMLTFGKFCTEGALRALELREHS